jgi:hypothetical protein
VSHEAEQLERETRITFCEKTPALMKMSIPLNIVKIVRKSKEKLLSGFI